MASSSDAEGCEMVMEEREDVTLKKGCDIDCLWRCGLHPLCVGSKLGPSLPALHCLDGNFLDCITLLERV